MQHAGGARSAAADQACIRLYYAAAKSAALRQEFLALLPLSYTGNASECLEEFLIAHLAEIDKWMGAEKSKPFMWRAQFCISKLKEREQHVTAVMEAYHTAVTSGVALPTKPRIKNTLP